MWFIVVISLATGAVVYQTPLPGNPSDQEAQAACPHMVGMAANRYERAHPGERVTAECRKL